MGHFCLSKNDQCPSFFCKCVLPRNNANSTLWRKQILKCSHFAEKLRSRLSGASSDMRSAKRTHSSSERRFRVTWHAPHELPLASATRRPIGKISAKCCSFSAVSAPIFASKYAFVSIFQNLPDFQAEILEIWQNLIFANFATFAIFSRKSLIF